MVSILNWALACFPVEANLSPIEVSENDAVPNEHENWIFPAPAPFAGFADRPLPAESTGAPGEKIFEENTIHDFEILLSDTNWSSLRDHPDKQVEGVLVWRGVHYGAGIKLKGMASYRSIRQKAAFKIDVHEYLPESRIDGLKRLTLNNMVQDETMLREHSYYWLARQLSIPASRHGYARLEVNGEPYGLYGIVESLDGQQMKRLFPHDKDGNLYEASGADFTQARNWFDLQVDGGLVPTPDDIDSLVDTLEATGRDDFAQVFGERFETDSVLGYMALDAVTGNDDGYVFNHHNYQVYRFAYTDRWVMLPWGTDRSFTQDVSPFGSSSKPVVGDLTIRCLDDDACSQQLREQMERVLEVWENGGFKEMLASTVELIQEECEIDPRKDKECDQEEIVEFVDQRAQFIREKLE